MTVEEEIKILHEAELRIGELLVRQKVHILKHGGFTKRVRENLPFTPRTAQRYIKAYLKSIPTKPTDMSEISNHGR